MHEVERPTLGIALVVRIVQPLANLHDYVAHLRQGHGLAMLAQTIKDAAQVAPVDVLEGDEVRVVHFAEIEDLGDVCVLQLHRNLRLVDEHRDELFILGDVGKDALERDDPLKALHAHDLGLEHLGHAPNVDAFKEVVFSKRSGLVQATTPKRGQRVISLSTTGRVEVKEAAPIKGDRKTAPPDQHVRTLASSGERWVTPRSRLSSYDRRPESC